MKTFEIETADEKKLVVLDKIVAVSPVLFLENEGFYFDVDTTGWECRYRFNYNSFETGNEIRENLIRALRGDEIFVPDRGKHGAD